MIAGLSPLLQSPVIAWLVPDCRRLRVQYDRALPVVAELRESVGRLAASGTPYRQDFLGLEAALVDHQATLELHLRWCDEMEAVDRRLREALTQARLHSRWRFLGLLASLLPSLLGQRRQLQAACSGHRQLQRQLREMLVLVREIQAASA